MAPVSFGVRFYRADSRVYHFQIFDIQNTSAFAFSGQTDKVRTVSRQLTDLVLNQSPTH